MDIQKTMEFLIEQQAKFESRFAAFESSFRTGMEELRQNQQATERLINAFANAGAAQIELHRARLDSVERRLEADEQRLAEEGKRFQAFLDRFDAFLRGQQGNGHAS
jgi:hypothetical protein